MIPPRPAISAGRNRSFCWANWSRQRKFRDEQVPLRCEVPSFGETPKPTRGTRALPGRRCFGWHRKPEACATPSIRPDGRSNKRSEIRDQRSEVRGRTGPGSQDYGQQDDGTKRCAGLKAASLGGIKLRSEFRQTAGAFGLRRSARRHICYFFRRRRWKAYIIDEPIISTRSSPLRPILYRTVDLIKDCACTFKRIRSFKLVRLVTAFPNALQPSLW